MRKDAQSGPTVAGTAFTLPDGSVALVHLTFHPETSPAYPSFKVLASKAEALPRLALLERGEAYE